MTDPRRVFARTLAAWSLVLSGIAAPAAAQHVERVKDINIGFSPNHGSNPTPFFDAAGIAYFAAFQPTTGQELWRSDGTEIGTYLVKDIGPGTNGSPQSFAAANGFVFFAATDPVSGTELWKTDGTSQGTTLVKDVWPGSGPSAPSDLVSIGGTVYFAAFHPSFGRELWKSDGTPEGTVLVQDIAPGIAYSSPTSLTNIGGTLYFQAFDDMHGTELWKSDGTPGGTVLVKDILPGFGNSNVGPLVAVGGFAVFAANDGIAGQELWRTNGTAAGTVPIANLRAGGTGSFPTPLAVMNGILYFTADDGIVGRELWKTDGTPVGTSLVRDIRPGPAASSPLGGGVLGNILVFAANDGFTGVELWRTDGTAAGTIPAADVWPGPASGVIGSLTVLGNRLIFNGNSPSANSEIWATDGTPSGTVFLRDIAPGFQGSNINSMARVGNRVFFGANDGVYGQEPWVTDGTPAGTVMLRDVYESVGSALPVELTEVNGTLFFAAEDGLGPQNLWKTDGFESGTVRITNLPIGAGPSPAQLVTELTALGNTLYFSAWTPSAGAEIWKSDGSLPGTAMVRDLCPGPCGQPQKLTDIGGTLYFTDDTGLGSELYRSDGTFNGTFLVSDIIPGPGSSSPDYLTAFQGQVFFSAFDGVTTTLWKSNGTPGGTLRVVTAGPFPRNVKYLTVMNGQLFFVADDGPAGAELWKTDGTSAGTRMVIDIRPGISSNPENLVAVGNRLYFTADDGFTGVELWKTDGTAPGTVRVTDINFGPASSSPRGLVDVLGNLYFSADDGITGRELWTADNTGFGPPTFLVEDIAPGPGSSSPRNLIQVNGTLFFTADGPEGAEMWRSDGRMGGTRLVVDLEAGPSPSNPGQYTPVVSASGTNVFFSAYTSDDGTELRILRNRRPTAAAGPDVTINPGQSVTLTAFGSADPDGDPLGYQWQAPTGPPLADAPAVTVSPSFTTTYTLTVRDGFGGVGTDTVTVFVTGTPTVPLYVTVNGTEGGLGTVSVDPPGAICDNLNGSHTCVYTYPQGTPVTLVASPIGSSTFIGWTSGACLGPLPTCQVTVDQLKFTTALFRGPQMLAVTLQSQEGGWGTVNISPPNTQCVNTPGSTQTCTNLYRIGTVVQLAAFPSPDSVFIGWTSGACSGPLVTCQVTVDQAKSTVALFRGPQVLAVTLESLDGGSGTVNIDPPNTLCVGTPGAPTTCANQYRIGTVVHLAAFPSPDSVFVGWTSGACSGPLVTCQVTVDAAKTTTATFRLNHPPVAVPGGPYSALRNTAIAFDGTGSSDADGDPLTYAWDFGDGATGTGPNPTHAYAAIGTYTVTLTVQDGRVSSAPATTTVSIVNARPVAVVSGGPQSGVRGQVLTFEGSGSSDGDGDTLTYAWDFGDGGTGSGPTSAHAYTSLGTFTVTLVVSDGIDTSAPASVTVTIANRAPVASVGGPYSGTHGVPVVFDGSASTDADGDPLTFAWTFGDGGTGSGPAPSHTYATDGSYTVTVEVGDGVDTATASTTVTVANLVPVARPGGAYTGFRNAPIAFDGSASSDGNGDALTYAWDFGDGSTGSGPAPTHAYTSLGTFTVTLVVSDGIDTSAPASATVTIANRAPVASVGGPYSGTHGAAVAFDASTSTDADGDPLTFAWTFGDGGTGSGPAPSHTYATDGSYTVTVEVGDGVDTATASTTVTIANLVPVARPGGPYTGFKNAPFVLDGRASSDGNGDALTYRWNFGDGALGTGAMPSHTYDMPPGYLEYIYNVTLIVNDGLTDSAPVVTTVQVKDHLPVANPGGPYTTFRNQPIALNGSLSSDEDGDPLTYRWDFGDGALGTGATPSHAYASFGTFFVRLIVNDGYMDSGAAQTLVTVPDRRPLANAGGPYAGVRGAAITFNGSASVDPDGDPLTYQWNFGDGATGTGVNPTHAYTTVGSFVARLVVSDGGPQASVESTAVVTIANRPPVANPGGPYAGNRTQPVHFSGAASTDPDGDPLTYAWNFGDGATGTGASPTHLYNSLGTRTVTLTVNDGFVTSPAVTTTVTITNVAPISNAGPDRTVVRNTSVTLDGRGSSDPDGTITYSWRRVSGPTVTLINPNTAQPRFTAPNVSSTQVITFELKVTDNNGATALDTVRITVTR